MEQSFSKHGLQMPDSVKKSIDNARKGKMPKGLDIWFKIQTFQAYIQLLILRLLKIEIYIALYFFWSLVKKIKKELTRGKKIKVDNMGRFILF